MRQEIYDILKGYAILLVVLGHVIQCFYIEWQTNIVELFIYSFHMPLFIAISGHFFLDSVDKRTITDFVKLKTRHLLLPSLTIGFINCCIIGGGKLIKHSTFQTSFFVQLFFTGLWFLTVLFILSFIGCILRKYLKGYMIFGWCIVLLILYFMPSIWMSHELKYLAPFFVGSIILRKYQWDRIPYWILILCTGFFIIMLYNFDFSDTVYNMSDDVFTMSYCTQYFYRLAIGVLGILCSLLLIRILFNSAHLRKIFLYLGGLTLPIYVLHQKYFDWNIIVNYKTGSFVLVLLFTLIVIFLSIITYKFLRRYEFIALLLFGESSHKKSK